MSTSTGAGPSGSGDVEGFLDGRSHVLDFHNQEIVLGDGQRDASHVGFLECVATNSSARHLPGDCHHRHRVHLGGGDASNQVGGAGAAGGGADANPSGGAGVSVAAMAAACSWRTSTCRKSGYLAIAPYRGRTAPPGNPKTISTSSFRRLSQTISAPLSFIHPAWGRFDSHKYLSLY